MSRGGTFCYSSNELIALTMKLLNNLKKTFFSYSHSPIIRQEAKKCQK